MATKQREQAGFEQPARDAVAVTPGSSALATPCKALYIGGAGNVNVITEAGTTTLFSGATAGSVLPVRCTHVLSTSTTATSIVALY